MEESLRHLSELREASERKVMIANISRDDVKPGDVFQVNEQHNRNGGRSGWVGAFILCTEVRSWGIVGFLHCCKEHDIAAKAYIRLPFEEVEYVGHAALVPETITEE